MKIKFTTTIDSDLLEAAKIKAVKEKRSVASMVEDLLKEYLNCSDLEQSAERQNEET